jgi:hypothetical protein
MHIQPSIAVLFVVAAVIRAGHSRTEKFTKE